MQIEGATETNSVVTLIVNGEEQEEELLVLDDGLFSTELALEEEENIIIINAVDKAGNDVQEELSVFFDNRGPVAYDVFPNSGTFSSLENITVFIEERAGQFDIENSIARLTDSEGELIGGGAVVETQESLVVLYQLPELEDGEYVFTFTPVDEFGHEGKSERVLFRIHSDAPGIDVLSPVSSETEEFISRFVTQTFSGLIYLNEALLAENVQLDHVELELNDNSYSITNSLDVFDEAEIPFSYQADSIEGENEFRIIAIDSVGNTGQTSMYTYYIDRRGPIPFINLENIQGERIGDIQQREGCGNLQCEYIDHEGGNDCPLDCAYVENIGEYTYQPPYVYQRGTLSPLRIDPTNKGVYYTLKYKKVIEKEFSEEVQNYKVIVRVHEFADDIERQVTDQYRLTSTYTDRTGKRHVIRVYNDGTSVIWIHENIIIAIEGDQYPGELIEKYIQRYPSTIGTS